MGKPELILMVGNIVSGKSTWIKTFLESLGKDYIVVSKDAIRRMFGAGRYIYNEKYEPTIDNITTTIVYRLMELKVNIIIDETNLTKDVRSSYINLTKKFKYTTTAIVMNNPNIEEVKRRIALRQNKIEWGNGSKEHWLSVWELKNKIYEKPIYSEGLDNIITINN